MGQFWCYPAPMIDHDTFGKLRLVDFQPPSKVYNFDDYRLLGRIWVGESRGFTKFIRLPEQPHVVRLVELDLFRLKPRAISRIFNALDLPLARGMPLAEVEELLGKGKVQKQFVADRLSYEFHIPSPRYNVNCTVLNDGGLIYVVVDNL